MEEDFSDGFIRFQPLTNIWANGDGYHLRGFGQKWLRTHKARRSLTCTTDSLSPMLPSKPPLSYWKLLTRSSLLEAPTSRKLV